MPKYGVQGRDWRGEIICFGLTICLTMYILNVYTKRNGGLTMLTAKVFQSGNSQAIRIPKEMQTQEKEFIIKKYGNCLFLLPADDPWALLRQSLGQLDEKDAPFERDQPALDGIPEREAL